MSDAHIDIGRVVVSRDAAAGGVQGGRALPVHLLVPAARAAGDARLDVVPELRERSRWTRGASALPRARARRVEVGAGRAAVAGEDDTGVGVSPQVGGRPRGQRTC